MIDQLSRSLDLSVDDEQQNLWRIDDLARHASVSTKTLLRWRREGLRWRWMRIQVGRPAQIVIPESAWQHFAEVRPDRVQYAASFTQISKVDRTKLIKEARELASQHNLRLNPVATRLSRKHGRALETIRLLLRKHDQDHPHQAIFKNSTGPIDARQRRVIARAHRMGMTVSKLSEHFQRTPGAIYRILHLQRAQTLRDRPASFVPSAIFERDDAETVILRQPIDDWLAETIRPGTRKLELTLADLPELLRAIYDQPSLDDATANRLLVRYNFLKFRFSQMQDKLDRRQPRVSVMDRMDELWLEAARCRLVMVQHHLPVVYSIARRQTMAIDGPTSVVLMRLLEAGNVELYEIIEQYNTRVRLAFASVLRNRLLGRYARDHSPDKAAKSAKQQAHRRDEAQRVWQRMVQTAQHHGIDLEQISAGAAAQTDQLAL